MAKKKMMWFGIIGVKKLDKKGYTALIKKIGIFAVAAFVVSVIVFMAIALLGNFSEVLKVASTANLWIYLLAFVAVFAGFLLKYCKWTYYIKELGLKVPARKNFAVYMSVYSMDITPARIGRIVAAYTLNRITSIKFAQIVPIVTMDIFTDFLGTAILALVASLYLNRYVVYVTVVDILLLIPFVFIIDDWLYNIIKKHMKEGRLLRLFSIYGDQYYASQSVLNNSKIYLTSILFTLPAELLNSMALYFTLKSIGVMPSLTESIFAYSTTLVFGMVSSLPGGIGVTDGTMVALLHSVYGLSTAVSSAATIMSRMATLWFGVILGAAFLAYTVRYWNTKGNKRKD